MKKRSCIMEQARASAKRLYDRPTCTEGLMLERSRREVDVINRRGW